MEHSPQFKASSNQAKEWFESIVWQDFSGEVRLWIQELQGILESEDTRNIVDVARAQGAIRMAREILELQESLPYNIEVIDQQLRMQKTKENTDE